MTTLHKVKIKDKLAQQHWADLMYSSAHEDGKAMTISETAEQILIASALFEKFTGDQLFNWLQDNYPDKWAEYQRSLTPQTP